MKIFLDDIIAYLDSKFANDTSIGASKKPKGYYAYKSGLEPDTTEPFYTIQLLDNSTASETFLREITINVPIQINVFGIKMNINNITHTAQESSIVLGEKIIEFMEEFKYSNKNLIACRRITTTPAMPYEDGTKAYTTIIRYNIEINVPYVATQELKSKRRK